MALSVAAQREWCVALHVKKAIGAGVTREELIEAGFFAVLIHAGPAMMYMTPLLKVADEFGAAAA